MVQVRPKRNSILKSGELVLVRWLLSLLLPTLRAILTLPCWVPMTECWLISAMNHLDQLVVEEDPLDALNTSVTTGVDDNANVNMFLNLQNIEDGEMSTDFAKHK